MRILEINIKYSVVNSMIRSAIKLKKSKLPPSQFKRREISQENKVQKSIFNSLDLMFVTGDKEKSVGLAYYQNLFSSYAQEIVVNSIEDNNTWNYTRYTEFADYVACDVTKESEKNNFVTKNFDLGEIWPEYLKKKFNFTREKKEVKINQDSESVVPSVQVTKRKKIFTYEAAKRSNLVSQRSGIVSVKSPKFSNVSSPSKAQTVKYVVPEIPEDVTELTFDEYFLLKILEITTKEPKNISNMPVKFIGYILTTITDTWFKSHKLEALTLLISSLKRYSYQIIDEEVTKNRQK